MKAPKDPAENVRYRRAILTRAANDADFQHECWIAAARDPVWYCDTFGWTYSPAEFPDCPNRPFILWNYQEDMLQRLLESIGKWDMLIEKSRDMGASWVCTFAIEHRWHFRPRQSVLLGSRKEDYVDKSGDSKSLMWKLDYFIENLPGWLRPNVDRIKLHAENTDNHSTIDGESTNTDFARGDRRNVILLDEFPAVENGYEILAATRDATKTRWLNGTYQGAAGAYPERAKEMKQKTPERVISLHWSIHPIKRVGLYTSEGDEGQRTLKIIDEAYVFPDNYPFILDGKLRSPWYDDQCDRAGSEKEIAQELDMDPANSGWNYFDPVKLDRIITRSARRALLTGELAFDDRAGSPIFTTHFKGRVQLWTQLDSQGRVPRGEEYAAGCDIATGSGGKQASNSVCSIGHRKTGQKVAQFTTNQLKPVEFCRYAVALCRLFNGAVLNFEDNGPGQEFLRELIDLGYRNVFYRDSGGSAASFITNKSDKIGWHSNKDPKRHLLSSYFKALISGEFENPCREALEECRQYIHQPDGTIEHQRAASTEDPTESGENHGDMVIADAVLWLAMQDAPQQREVETYDDVDPHTFGGRLRKHLASLETTSFY